MGYITYLQWFCILTYLITFVLCSKSVNSPENRPKVQVSHADQIFSKGWKKEEWARLKLHADKCLFVQLYTCWVSWNVWVHCEVDMSDLKTWRFRYHSDAMTWFYCVTERTRHEHSIKWICLPLIWCSVCDTHQNSVSFEFRQNSR